MVINYDSRADVLYIRLSNITQELVNRRVTEDIVLDLGEDDSIVGIEILQASKKIKLTEILPIEFNLPKAG